jgi:hypothetical protein
MEAENTSGIQKHFPQHNTTNPKQNNRAQQNTTQHNTFHVSERQTENRL